MSQQLWQKDMVGNEAWRVEFELSGLTAGCCNLV